VGKLKSHVGLWSKNLSWREPSWKVTSPQIVKYHCLFVILHLNFFFSFNEQKLITLIRNILNNTFRLNHLV
jgi:hypothetical protein